MWHITQGWNPTAVEIDTLGNIKLHAVCDKEFKQPVTLTSEQWDELAALVEADRTTRRATEAEMVDEMVDEMDAIRQGLE